MKNISKHLRWAALAILLSTPFVSQAQYSHLYYHCQGDTIIGDAEIYYHSWWEFENSLYTQQLYNFIYPNLPTNKMLLYHFSDKELQVVGLAIVNHPEFGTYPGEPYRYYDTSIIREYLYLCEAGVDTTYELAKVRWLPADTSRFIKLRHMDIAGLADSIGEGDKISYSHYQAMRAFYRTNHNCCGGEPYTNLFPVAEYYFDTPITVTDSFYVGCSNLSCDPTSSCPYLAGKTYPQQQYMMATQNQYVDCNGDTADWFNSDYAFGLAYLQPENLNDVCRIYWPAIIENHWSDYGDNPMSRSPYNPDGTYYVQTPYIPLVFPIVMVDTTVPPRSYCPKVENLQLSSDSTGCINLSWDAFVGHRNGYDIYFGLSNVPQSQWNYLYVTNNFAQICDLNPNVFYQFRVAPVCDSLQNSAQWITSQPFQPGSSDSVAVTEPSLLARHTLLAPNPTTGKVHLHSDYVVTRLDLYDPQGHHLEFLSYPGLDTDLDLSHYPSGLYHLVITTSQGITTKQIIKK